jgi:hypothetical protein
MIKKWLWVDASTAAALAAKRDATLEILRKGYGYLGPEQFVIQLGSNDLRIIIFKNRAAALVQLVPYTDGVVCNILTVHGNIKSCDNAIEWIEQAAKEAGANLLVSIGHAGWERIMKKHGYEIEKRLLMRKVLK